MPALFDTFKTRAEAVSAEVHRVATRSDALDFIVSFPRAEQRRAVWVPGCAMQIRGGLDKDGAPIEVKPTDEPIAGRFDAADREVRVSKEAQIR